MGTKFATAMVKSSDSFKAGFDAAKQAQEKNGNVKTDLSVVFASSNFNYQDVVRGVRQATGNAPLIGCSTAGEFTEAKVDTESVACAVIASDTHTFLTGLGKGLRDNEILCFKEAIGGFLSSSPRGDSPHRSFLVLIDGLSGKGEEVSLAALSTLGTGMKLAGGSAGDNYHFKSTSVFSNDTAISDAISIAQIVSKVPIAIGVDHGHNPISCPFTVTKAQGNKVYELDGKPAVRVWLDAARESAKKFGIDVDTMWENPEQLGKFSFIYEGGLLTGNGYKIRWSGISPDTKDFLPFVCTIPEGAALRVMESTKESEIESARNAARYALKNLGNRKIAGALIFDCAVRGALLGGEFPRAISEIRSVIGDVPLIGLETYGEIALEEGQLSGFHNTTTVVVLIPD